MLERYSKQLANEFRKNGKENYTKCIEEKFEENPNVIVEDKINDNILEIVNNLRMKHNIFINVDFWETSQKSWKEGYNPDEYNFYYTVSRYNKLKEDTVEDTFEDLFSSSVNYVSFKDGFEEAYRAAFKEIEKRNLV